jgi:hypothetical protein
MKVLRWVMVLAGLLMVGGGAALGLAYGPTVDYDGLFGDSSQTCDAPFLFSEEKPTQAQMEAFDAEYPGTGAAAANRYQSCADAVGALRLVAAGLILVGLVVAVTGVVLVLRDRRRRSGAEQAAPVGPQIGAPPPPQRAPLTP